MLICGVCSEVVGSLSLKAALAQPAWYVMVAVGWVTAFLFLAAVLRAGMALGVAYGIWAALGVALTAALGALVFDEPLTGVTVAGMTLIIGGVLLIELGAHRAGPPQHAPHPRQAGG